MDKVGLIMDFESGDISEDDFLKLFSELIKTGECWTLQGSYGRTASLLIGNGVISSKGEILRRIEDEFCEDKD